MPNWCQNVATITHEDGELIDNIENELKKDKDDSGLFQMLRPRPSSEEENWYSWNIENWGTKWEASVYDFERVDDHTIKINFDTAWGPCVSLYEHLETEGYTVEGFYNEEGMAFCGCYRDGFDDSYNYSDYYTSSGIRDNVPSEIDEMFNISERLADSEDEEEFEDDEDSEPTYEMTNWFSFLTKPTYVGIYEVKTLAWPSPHKAQWTGKEWRQYFGPGEDIGSDKLEITEWRGITEAEHNSLVELQKLKDEFDKLMVEETE